MRAHRDPAGSARPVTIYASRQMKSIFSVKRQLRNLLIPSSQVAPAGLATLIYRYRLDEINTTRDLPAAKSRPTMREQLSLAQATCYYASYDFLIPPLRVATENNRHLYSRAAQDLSFHLGRVHFLAGNVDQVGSASDKPVSGRRLLQQ